MGGDQLLGNDDDVMVPPGYGLPVGMDYLCRYGLPVGNSCKIVHESIFL